jgi:recombination protein RecA
MPREKLEKKSFESLYSQFSNQYEDGKETTYIPTGSVVIDSLLGGGLPSGKLIEVASKAGVGKTLIAKHLSEAVMKYTSDKTALFLDIEKGLNNSLLVGPLQENMGKRFGVFRISTFEDAEAIIKAFADAGNLALVVVDSITALLPKDVVEGEIGNLQPGKKAQWEGVFLNKQKTLAHRLGYSILFVNQVRAKLNFRGMTTIEGSGGNAMRHYPDVRFSMRVVKPVKNSEDESVEGAEVEMKSLKNRLVGNKIANVHLIYGKGIDNIATYIAYLASFGFLNQAGSMFELDIPGLIKERVRGKEALHAIVSTHSQAIGKILMERGVTKEATSEEISQGEEETA